MARATTTVFLALSCAAKTSAFAPERAPVDLAGFTHLEALGIAAPQRQRPSYTAAWFEAPSLHSKTIPSLPGTLPTGTTADTSKCFPLLNASSPLVSVFDCQLKCSYCVELDPTGERVLSSNATCVEIASGKAATAKGGPNVTTTIYSAFENMTVNVLGGNATHADCNCALVDVQGPVGCTYRMATCSYLVLPQAGKSPELLSRATTWSVADLAGSSARSPGYENPLAGVSLSPPSGSYEKEAYTLAAQAFQARPDAGVCAKPAALPPLVVVPGLTSSALEYELQDSSPPPWAFWCARTTQGWKPLWPNSDLSHPESHLFKFLCWVANVQVQFDPTSKTFEPARQGEKTRTVDFGGTDGVPGLGVLWGPLQAAGWRVSNDLFVAPFDWRLPSVAQAAFFNSTKALVERAAARNGGKKVVIWAFSFGPQYTLSFLHRMSSAWKERFIAAFVATSPVWSGAPAAMTSYVSGYAAQSAGLNTSSNLLKQLVRAVPSLVWAFPRAGSNRTVSWTRDDVLVATRSKNYTAFDFSELLGKLGVSDTAVAQYEYLANEADLADFAAPGCDTLVTYGVGLPTTSSLVFADQDVSKHLSPPTSVMFEDGDGLVPRRSPLRSHSWATAHAAMHKSLGHREYLRQPHAQCVSGPTVISGGSPHVKAALPGNPQGECYRGVLEYFMRYA
jgi:hypothetical protein